MMMAEDEKPPIDANAPPEPVFDPTAPVAAQPPQPPPQPEDMVTQREAEAPPPSVWGVVGDVRVGRETSTYLTLIVGSGDNEVHIDVPKKSIHPQSHVQRYGDSGELIAHSGALAGFNDPEKHIERVKTWEEPKPKTCPECGQPLPNQP